MTTDFEKIIAVSEKGYKLKMKGKVAEANEKIIDIQNKTMPEQ